MPRPIRFFVPGHVWHITHRCHDREFLLDYAVHRNLWIKWLAEGSLRYGVPILNFTVTSNHIHLLVLAPEDKTAIPRLMQLVAGRVGQIYNKKQCRKGSFWEDRYYATAVQTGEHLARCFLYIDLNMVRAKVVNHPAKWQHGGYHEIVKPKKRYRLINRDEVGRLLEIEEKDLSKIYQARIKEALRKGNLSRDDIWTVSLAVGDDGFVEKVKKSVGRFVAKMNLREEPAAYGRIEQVFENSLEWKIFDESEL
ncbi:transposase [Desulfoplanes sp. PS50]